MKRELGEAPSARYLYDSLLWPGTPQIPSFLVKVKSPPYYLVIYGVLCKVSKEKRFR